MNKHILNVKAVLLYGEEDLLVAEKTWPLAIPENMRLTAILINKFFWGNSSLEIAIDITERERYEMYIEQVRNKKWSSMRIFYVPVDKIDLCRQRPDS